LKLPRLDRKIRVAVDWTPLPPLRMFFERLIEDRMAPMATQHV